MNTQIFIPEKLKVGYNNRVGTYTGKLAYIIYYDAKGKLRKEKSWTNWKDKKIPVDDFENKAIDGFVLNKKAGGDRYGWNPRQTYCRVYDPRGFEFEITIPNLLYILENTNSIVGKGLEGKFIYGWSGKDLVLIPEKAPEFAEMQKHTKLQAKDITRKDLIPGHIYKTKKQKDLMYLGYFPTWNSVETYHKSSVKVTKLSSKRHWFYDEKTKTFIYRSDYKNLAEKVTDKPSMEYAHIMDKIQHHSAYSPYEESKFVYTKISLPIPHRDYTYKYIKYNSKWRSINYYLSSSGELTKIIVYGVPGKKHRYFSKQYDDLELERSPNQTEQEFVDSIGGIYTRKKYLKNGKEEKYR